MAPAMAIIGHHYWRADASRAPTVTELAALTALKVMAPSQFFPQK
jgi:hypothetical protein